MKILEDLIEMKMAVEQELGYVRENRVGRSIHVYNGVLQTQEDNYFKYKFETADEKRIFEDTPVTLHLKSGEFDGSVLATEVQYVTLIFAQDLGEALEEAVIEEDLSALYQKIIERIEYCVENEKDFSTELVDQLFYSTDVHAKINRVGTVDFVTPPNSAQKKAIQSALSFPVSFVWGPPGTGKTKTLSMMMFELMMQGKRVLVVSHANKAVDNALGAFLKLAYEQEVSREDLHSMICRYMMTLLNTVGEISLSEYSYFEQQESYRRAERFERDSLKAMMSRKATLSEIVGLYIEQRNLSEQIEKFEDEIDASKKDRKQELKNEIKLLTQRVEQIDGYIATIAGLTMNEDAALVELAEISKRIEEFGGEEEVKKRINKERKIDPGDVLFRKHVVFTTLAKVATDDVFKKLRFDAVIIEEASMAPLPLVALAASIAKERIIVAGDPQQLPPIALVQTAETQRWLSRDIFTNAASAESVEDLYSWEDRNTNVTFLDTQYRMPMQLSDLVSRYFYKGKILNAFEDAEQNAVVVVDTKEFNPSSEREQRRYGTGSSKFNVVHAEVITQLIQSLLYTYKVEDIGVISPYRAQATTVKKFLRSAKVFGVEVGTIHTFQGREKPVIIFDTTDAPPERPGIMLDEKRMKGDEVLKILTVAFSRSQERLFIVAHVPYLVNSMPHRKLTQIISMYSK